MKIDRHDENLTEMCSAFSSNLGNFDKLVMPIPGSHLFSSSDRREFMRDPIESTPKSRQNGDDVPTSGLVNASMAGVCLRFTWVRRRPLRGSRV
jgi:hypothetical protein